MYSNILNLLFNIIPYRRKVYKKVTVQGRVVNTYFATKSKGKPTFINIEGPRRNVKATVVIWGENRKNFGETPEKMYQNKNVSVSGNMKVINNKETITIRKPKQIRILE